MELKDKIVVVTGAAGGIGRAMALRFAQDETQAVVCADIDADGAAKTASEINGISFGMDAAKESDIAHVIDQTERDIGPIDLFCSNAGISIGGGVEVRDAEWQKTSACTASLADNRLPKCRIETELKRKNEGQGEKLHAFQQTNTVA